MNSLTINSRAAAGLLMAAVLSVSGSVALAGQRAVPQATPAATSTVVTADVSDAADTSTDTTKTDGTTSGATAAKPKKEAVTPPAPVEENVRPAQERASHAINTVQVIRGSLFAAGEAPVSGSADEHARTAPVASYTSVVPMEPHKFQKHDIITIIVREDSTNTSTGQTQAEKKQDFDMALEQYLKFSLANLSLGTTNPSTAPEVKFKYDNNRQNNANTQRTDSTALRIAATIVDVKPNGSLVIEATKQITMDREVQDYTLSGICRSDDVATDNTVLSTQLADLKLKKNTSGEVRDGTKRGWLNSLIDKFGAF